ncbi:MAG: type II secretion system F family protein [Thermococcus sp.]|uniref:Type II secretion protein F n=1 Tax=Thermococcus guaymasensis DSM 11113 TaxID=1432656 RepID=A0A0X1KK33_9EURY|nr:type II secretion system F family protein [Thermococcus guaymasensis]AJC71592.1 type II secretion protein F [Thermococcus guaymasensis DSM 11113]MCD6523463.1 type II secretion system F family protein [Thermococcus sp.]
MGIIESFLNFLEKLGGTTLEVAERPTRRLPRQGTIQERLRALKELQKETEETKESEREKELEEILEWRRKEITTSFGERLAEGFLKRFRGPVESMTKSIKGLDYDLYRANIRMSKEKYVALMILTSIFAGLFSFLFGILLEMDFFTSMLIGLLGFIGGFLYMRNYPKMVWRRRVAEVEKALPYVLRHMASLLSAGVGIAEALVSVAKADYGAASEEFELIVRDMRAGASFEEALERFEEKMGSENVSRVVKQILRAIKFGGNLAEILYKMAEDFAFEYRMKLVEYVQKVNGIAFIYMFMTIVMPTMFIVAILAGSAFSAQSGGGALALQPSALAVILLFAFPMLSLIIVTMIKRGEPR